MGGRMLKNAARRWLRRHHIYEGKLNRVLFYPEHSDLPVVPRASELAIAGTQEHPKWALLDCPCGRGHTILLPLSPSAGVHWRVVVDANGCPSISPSIDRDGDDGVRCHFWIRNGKANWA